VPLAGGDKTLLVSFYGEGGPLAIDAGPVHLAADPCGGGCACARCRQVGHARRPRVAPVRGKITMTSASGSKRFFAARLGFGARRAARLSAMCRMT
jgi:hypothetical protein